MKSLGEPRLEADKREWRTLAVPPPSTSVTPASLQGTVETWPSGCVVDTSSYIYITLGTLPLFLRLEFSEIVAELRGD